MTSDNDLHDLNRMECQGYHINVPMDGVITVDARLVIFVSGQDKAERVSEALHRIGIFFNSGDIQLVKASDEWRCFYCGTKAALNDKVCVQCGAPL